MIRKFHSNAHGQSLVFFIILSFALLVFMAVIFDGGNAYAMRRLAQNAADAGALAGARELCVTGLPGSAITVAERYAEEHNLARLSNTVSQTSSASVASGLVDVDVNINYNTFFARIIGMDQMSAVANAQAGCFAPGAGEGIMPIAWECPSPNMGNPDNPCNIEFDADKSCTLGTDTYYVFVDDAVNGYICESVCTANPSNPACSTALKVDCNTRADNSGPDNIRVISPINADKSWYWVQVQDLASGARDLRDVVKYGTDLDLTIHTWLPNTSGVISKVYQDAWDYHSGDIIAIPVYDDTCQGDNVQADCPAKWHPTLDSYVDPSGASGQQYFFHIISFSLMRLACVEAPGTGIQCPAKKILNHGDTQANPIPSDVRTFEGCFIDGFMSGIKGRPSDGIDAGAWTIYLVK